MTTQGLLVWETVFLPLHDGLSVKYCLLWNSVLNLAGCMSMLRPLFTEMPNKPLIFFFLLLKYLLKILLKYPKLNSPDKIS